MRLFEFEAKALLKGYGIPIPSSKIARSVEEVSIGRPSVLKAHIPCRREEESGWGDPENSLSWDELIEKFHDLSSRFMTKERCLKIVDQLRRLEKIRDLQKWSTFLLRNR
jgi:succinyl-CoA synthetase beta subunit